MHREDIAEILSDSDLQELLNNSKDLITKVDETIILTPLPDYVCNKDLIQRKLFMNARAASFDICVLAKSLLNDESHHFSHSIEYSARLLWECTIDFFYIIQSDESVTDRYSDFLDITNSEKEIREQMENDFKKKYGNPGRDFWSGKSRKEKIDQGLNKQSNIGEVSHNETFQRTFNYLNEHVHGNILMGSYWSFDKHGDHEHEYRGQIASGLLHVMLFYNVSRSYYDFTGRGFEKKHIEFYESYVHKLFSKLRK